MKKTFTHIFLIATLLSSAAMAEISLNRFNYKNDRQKQVKYRGVGVEMPFNQAVRAMLGDSDARMESMLVSGVKLLLMGKNVPFLAHINPLIAERGIMTEVNTAITANNGNYRSYGHAARKAISIVETNLKSFYSDGDIADLFIDYNSIHYMNYPNDPRSMIFSSIHPEIAGFYSNQMAVIKEITIRAVDLNLWNYHKNGIWTKAGRASFLDKGEFIHPVQIPAKDIIGYEIRPLFTKSFIRYRPLGNIDLGFYKIKSGKRDLVAIVSGTSEKTSQSHRVIINKGGKLFYGKSNIPDSFTGGVDQPKLPTATTEKVSVLGYIALCPRKATCHAPSSIFKEKLYKRSSRKMTAALLAKIKAISVRKKIAKIFTHDTPIDSGDLVSFSKKEFKERAGRR